jgi:hypothetical protein
MMADDVRRTRRLGNDPGPSEPMAGLAHDVADSLENRFGGFVCIDKGKVIASLGVTWTWRARTGGMVKGRILQTNYI